MRTERGNVTERGFATGECGSANAELVVSDGVKDTQSRIRAIAREQYDFDLWLWQSSIDCQKFLHQGEGNTRFEYFLLMLHLMTAKGILALIFEESVGVIQVK